MYGAPRDLPVLTHSFPPRLSSDLNAAPALEQDFVLAPLRHRCGPPVVPAIMAVHRKPGKPAGPALERDEIRWNRWPFSRRHRETPQGGFRSEEHTSELQSLMRISYAVFCLKKKKTKNKNKK